MKLVKGCKACHGQLLKNTSPSSEPGVKSTITKLSSQSLSEVDANRHNTISATWSHLAVINHKDIFQNQRWNLVSINTGYVFKGVALQYMLYSDLRPQSKCWLVKYLFWLLTRNIKLLDLADTLDHFDSVVEFIELSLYCCLNKGVTLQCILYSDLRRWSRWKSRDNHQKRGWSKVKLPFGWTKVNPTFSMEYGYCTS